jgi:enhancer of polycomb-like protein
MDQEDDTFLKFLNSQRNASTQCSEDCFEEVMNFFEETAQAKQPYAAVDSPPVVVYEDMESSFDENISENARAFAKDIYEHWKRRRTEVGNKSLITGLKVIGALAQIFLHADSCLARDGRRNGRC